MTASGKWTANILALHDLLQRMSIRDSLGKELTPDNAIEKWTRATLEVRDAGRSVFLVGNGASASMASHFAADVAKNVRIRTSVFTDLSLLTAVANDHSYEDVYVQPLRWFMQRGDMLVAISSSGDSPNVVRAVTAAGELGGMVVTLSAMRETNAIRRLGNLNFYVGAETYGMAETAHAAVLHYWVDMLVAGPRGIISKQEQI